MRGMALPRTLTDAVARNPERGRAEWLAGLPDLLADITDRWQLTVGPPFEPGGTCAWVAPAVTAAGEPTALKIGWSHPESDHEADALRLWDGRGAVRLHAVEVLGPSTVLLLERCEPGAPLSARVRDRDRDEVVAGLLLRLWIDPPVGHPFRPLAEMCAGWADEFEQKLDRALFAGSTDLDPVVAADGMSLFRSLPHSAPAERLLCTDLHAENILAAEREPWLTVDPKPYVGDPCYDVLQHMLNEDRLHSEPEKLAGRMADLVALDPDRVVQWTFARCVQECLDTPGLVDVARRLAACF